jgi:branched-chain amino acid transport system substrate-binding protein
MRRLIKISLASVMVVAMGSAWAQIKIGQTTGLTGPVAASVSETVAGAKLYLDAVNAKGGVGGQKIELITLDDGFDVKKTPENGRILIEEKKVIALF